MPITKREHHAPMSRASTHRSGGAVTLFNYNPSIAGGIIALHRFPHLHHQGRYLRHKAHEQLTTSTAGTGLLTPGHTSHGSGIGGNYQGLGATGRTAMHPITEDKKRLHEMIGKMMHGPESKRKKA
jgi:hypothetical protein